MIRIDIVHRADLGSTVQIDGERYYWYEISFAGSGHEIRSHLFSGSKRQLLAGLAVVVDQIVVDGGGKPLHVHFDQKDA